MTRRKWTIKQLLDITTKYLHDKAIESPRLTAEVLLGHLLQMDRVSLYLNFDRPLTESEVSGYRSLVRRRVQREPLQYITGVQEFWALEFKVDPRVLIPRPETELLVEHAIKIVKGLGDRSEGPVRILDLCTGCGAIAIALATEIPFASIWATDISDEALEVASQNAQKHGVDQNITFIHGNLWEPITKKGLQFHLIISNPPYVSTQEFNDLAPEIRNHEPRVALEAGPQGMIFLEKIIGSAHEYLFPGGWLIIEMAPWQTATALKMLEKARRYVNSKTEKDYSGKNRILLAQKLSR